MFQTFLKLSQFKIQRYFSLKRIYKLLLQLELSSTYDISILIIQYNVFFFSVLSIPVGGSSMSGDLNC